MSDIARVILTFDCDKDCSYCCNKYGHIVGKAKSICRAEELRGFSTILITGGEPMLKPEKVLSFIGEIKRVNPRAKIYLYTAKFTVDVLDILSYIDGVHFTLHADIDIVDVLVFEGIQERLFDYKRKNPDISFRLYIHPDIKMNINIVPYVWTRLESKPWLSEDECALPVNETLFKLEELIGKEKEDV